MLIKFLMVCLLVITQSVMAVEVKGLFEVEVIAQSQSREDRNMALRDALLIVFKRFLAGDAVIKDAVVKEALNHAPDYVDQYQYSLVSGAGDSSSARMMRVSFDEMTLMTVMRRSGLPIWNEMRDELLIWVVIEEGNTQRVLDVNVEADFKAHFQQAAKLKGMPILFPLMDLDEKRSVTPKEILSAYPGKIFLASQRYEVPAILSGKLVADRGCWASEWTLNFNNKIKQWKVPCLNIKSNLAGVFENAFDNLSVFYAVNSDGEHAQDLGINILKMKVMGIRNKATEKKVYDYLSKLPSVKAAKALQTKRGQCTYEIKFEGGREALEEHLYLGLYLREKGLSRDNTVLYEVAR